MWKKPGSFTGYREIIAILSCGR